MTLNPKQQFAKDVKDGLSAEQKYLPSRYFYDKKGDELFIKIMHSPEYYLTNAEFEIFNEQTQEIIDSFEIGEEGIELYELGAGDGTKTIKLLESIDHNKLIYKPIDISTNAIYNLEKRLQDNLPNLIVEGLNGEYFQVLSQIESKKKKVILFLGSNLGNMLDERAKLFLDGLSKVMTSGDKLLIGLDLIKPRDIVLPAYNDKKGYTRDFNLNLLSRINRELGANFELEKFIHLPEYSEETGLAKSYLQSIKKQEVYIKELDLSIQFEAGERIFTELSRKYNTKILQDLIKNTGLRVIKEFTDKQNYFTDFLIEKN